MKEKIQFHDSVIEEVHKTTDKLILKFRYFAVFEVYDSFGFNCGKHHPGYSGTITISSPSLDHEDSKKWPEPCDIYNGYIKFGLAQYSLVDLQLNIKEPCVLFIEANGSGETYFIFGTSIEINAHKT